MNKHEESFLEASGFNASWEAYIDAIREKNILSNERLIKVLSAVKGKDFGKDLRKVLKTTGEYRLMQLSKTVSGAFITDKRWKTIPQFHIDVRSDETGGMSGYMYVPVKENRFVKISVRF